MHMAHAKTTAAQVIAQLTIGAGLGSLLWYSLRAESPSVAPTPPTGSLERTLQSLEVEIQSNTTGKIWESSLEQKPQQNKQRSHSPSS
jgi:hypothetical protein